MTDVVLDFRPWVIMVCTVLALVISVASFRRQIKRDEVEQLERRIGGLETQIGRVSAAAEDRSELQSTRFGEISDRLVEVESRMEHMPSKEMVYGLQISQARIEGKVESITDGLASVKAGMQRIENYILRDK